MDSAFRRINSKIYDEVVASYGNQLADRFATAFDISFARNPTLDHSFELDLISSLGRHAAKLPGLIETYGAEHGPIEYAKRVGMDLGYFSGKYSYLIPVPQSTLSEFEAVILYWAALMTEDKDVQKKTKKALSKAIKQSVREDKRVQSADAAIRGIFSILRIFD